ncbi:unnamed protein product, partial [Ectocarpus sp. 12 AP-2014]
IDVSLSAVENRQCSESPDRCVCLRTFFTTCTLLMGAHEKPVDSSTAFSALHFSQTPTTHSGIVSKKTLWPTQTASLLSPGKNSRRQHPSDTALASSSPQNPHQRIGSSRVPATTSAMPRGVPAPGGGAPPPAMGDGSSSPKFLHNLRVWALGGPCVGVLLLLGGRPTSLGVAFGVMACYCFDLADNAEGALVSVWGAVLWSAGTLLWAGSTLGLVHKANVLTCVLLVGVWATLQFGTIYRDGPDAARLLERLLFSCFPLPAAAILTWAGVAFG